MNDDARNEDNDAFTIDAKTGKITSKYIMDFDSAVNWSGDGNATTAGDNVAAGGVMGWLLAQEKRSKSRLLYSSRRHNNTVTKILSCVL